MDDIRLIGGNVTGRYTLTSGPDGLRCYACRAQSITTSWVALSAPVSGSIGEPVNIHFPDFGILKGTIARLSDFGFVANLLGDDEHRAQMAAKIRWLRLRTNAAVPDHRAHKRFLPRNPRSSLLLADGRKYDCFIVNMSASGVSVSSSYMPMLGEAMAVGKAVGRVVRHHETGFAVRFAWVHELTNLEDVLRGLVEDTAMPEPQSELT